MSQEGEMFMMPIFLSPVFQERIWGGEKLRNEFGYEIPYERTGEAWVISAHPNGPSVIENGPLTGKTLKDAWENHPEMFNKDPESEEAYPLLVKILDANDELSVQVHPDDEYAQAREGQPYGKTECWYVLHAEEGAEIILGHHARSREELENWMDNGEWNSLLKREKVRAGDFIYVPSGTIHAIGKGIVILETQQSSDITYRVYDYDREDSAGNKRELHLERAKDVTTVPHIPASQKEIVTAKQGLTSTKLVQEQYFTVYRWQLNGKANLELKSDFLQLSVIHGSGEIEVKGQRFPFHKGSHFIIPHGVEEYEITGEAEFIVSHT